MCISGFHISSVVCQPIVTYELFCWGKQFLQFSPFPMVFIPPFMGLCGLIQGVLEKWVGRAAAAPAVVTRLMVNISLWPHSLWITILQSHHEMDDLIPILYFFFFWRYHYKHSRMHLKCFTCYFVSCAFFLRLLKQDELLNIFACCCASNYIFTDFFLSAHNQLGVDAHF